MRLCFLHTRPSGFTLIELLVVISIICLLMAISLPSLTGARQQGYRIACMSNMRALTQAWMMYAFDNDDQLCSGRTDWDLLDEGHWVVDGNIIPGNEIGGTADAIRHGVLWSYTGESLDLYKCRADRSDVLRSYSISDAMNGYERHAIEYTRFRRLHEITQSSAKLVFIDAQCHTNWIDGTFSIVRNRAQGWLTWHSKPEGNITARHSDGCNISLADGHCEHWKYRDQRTVAATSGIPHGDKSTVDNPDIERAMKLLGWPREELDATD